MENISYGQWIQDKLEELANQTKTDGQIWRPSYSDHDRTGHELLRTWITDAGLEWREDVIGNVYGRLSGVSTETILIGSHIDTVKNGGKYDGAAGVINWSCGVEIFEGAGGSSPVYTGSCGLGRGRGKPVCCFLPGQLRNLRNTGRTGIDGEGC